MCGFVGREMIFAGVDPQDTHKTRTFSYAGRSGPVGMEPSREMNTEKMS
jgi:hypothetical protein